jgi:hypothetical protein
MKIHLFVRCWEVKHGTGETFEISAEVDTFRTESKNLYFCGVRA